MSSSTCLSSRFVSTASASRAVRLAQSLRQRRARPRQPLARGVRVGSTAPRPPARSPDLARRPAAALPVEVRQRGEGAFEIAARGIVGGHRLRRAEIEVRWIARGTATSARRRDETKRLRATVKIQAGRSVSAFSRAAWRAIDSQTSCADPPRRRAARRGAPGIRSSPAQSARTARGTPPARRAAGGRPARHQRRRASSR